MKLKLIPHNKIDLKKWDAAILSSNTPLVFAQSFYLNATCPNWQALVLNDYEAVMPVTEGKKLNIKYLYQPPFTPSLGVFGKTNQHIIDLFLNYIKEHFKFVEIELNASNQTDSVTLKKKSTYVIDYSKPYSFNENTKRNINKAKKNEVEVEELDELKAILQVTSKALIPWLKTEIGIPAKHSTLFKDLVQSSFANGTLKVFAALGPDQELLSLGYFICNGKHAVYLKGMSTNKKDNLGSMHALMAHAVDYCKTQAQVFDFGGGNTAGMSNFYKGLGGTELNYHILKVNNLMWPLNKLKK
jgi:lipid II:glycine glycyltransferase (peptidoglycan interpeptide bridge formation enzyme)